MTGFSVVLPDIATIRQGRTVATLVPASVVRFETAAVALFEAARAKAMGPRMKCRPGAVR